MLIRTTLAAALLAFSATADASDYGKPAPNADSEVWIDSSTAPPPTLVPEPRGAETRPPAAVVPRRLVSPEPRPSTVEPERPFALPARIRPSQPAESARRAPDPAVSPASREDAVVDKAAPPRTSIRPVHLSTPKPADAQSPRVALRAVPSDAPHDPLPVPQPVPSPESAGAVPGTAQEQGTSGGEGCNECAACGSTPCHDFWCPPCNLGPHLPYRPPMLGYYYFRPYNAMHIRPQQDFVVRWGGDPRAPYANEIFQRVYANYAPAKRAAPETPKTAPPAPPPPAPEAPKTQPEVAVPPPVPAPKAAEPKALEPPKVTIEPKASKVPVPAPPPVSVPAP